ncbi:MAG TPA: multiheme c-type cytochrome, partial [Nitrospira sp.]|nr:multiheme c-type cytochrome [Nitrospira sp.]
MKGTRFIAGLFFALTLTGLFMRAGSIMGAWMSALGMTILHIILALVLLILMGSFLRRHVGGKSSAKFRALPLLASLLGIMVSGVALLLVGQRGRLPLLHWIFSLGFLFALFRHVGSILLRPALSDPALMLKLACIVAACLAVILTNRFLQQKTVLASEQILNTSVNIVGPLPGYDHGSMSPDSCANCHSQIVNEWKQSLHAVSDTEIVYARVVGEFRRKYSFEASNWCAGCHSPLRVARGELSTKVADVKQPNVDCVTCHSIQQIHEPIGSNNYDLSIQPAAGYEIGKI